jgi:hypothetical protein
MRPAEIKRGGRLVPVAPKSNELPQACHDYKSSSTWQREAARLFNEYWRTGQRSHLDAFVTHVIGMRLRLTGTAP